MYRRTLAGAACLISLSFAAYAAGLTSPGDPALSQAAARMKVKDFAGARDAALKSSATGARAFLLGMASAKQEKWEDAAGYLSQAAESYPLLADYALYHQGNALAKLGRIDQALQPLYRLLKNYPDSRLNRQATLLYADTLVAGNYHKQALDSYTVFIERYASGSDALSAQLGAALCRDRLGDPAGAAVILRNLWLNHPSSPTAERAGAELQRISQAGAAVPPYSHAELFKRAGILYDLGRYAQAGRAYQEIPLNGESADFVTKVRLRAGQALVKAKKGQEAEQLLKELAQRAGSPSEASFWLAKAQDRNGKTDQALELFLRLSQAPGSFADDALLEAAYLKRQQKRWGESVQLFQKFLSTHQDPQKFGGSYWDAAWTSYLGRDFPAAAGYLKKAAANPEYRERSLYWLGKTLNSLQDAKGAQQAFDTLAAEYPFGYYALICNRWCDLGSFPAPPKNVVEELPMPGGFEREKALIALGLYDEASRELWASKKKNPLGIARLFLEMENYNGAFHQVAKDNGKVPPERGNLTAWALTYPLAYREDVVKNAALTGLPESLIWAIMRAESNYHPGALSPVGAVGLMQVMPGTAEAMSKGDSVRLTRPELNIKLGARYLKDQMNSYDRSIVLTAAAYNAGPGNVKRWQKAFGGLPQDEFIESIPFKETREYVKKVLSNMELYQRLYRLPVEKKN
ncbi:murein transglycosylase [Geomonas silvestris]|uniref:Murein transglycosylase n=1 Tax=Geomonas silvestris TaxID=2740184 RepID=A0A6V8MD91_9BACT|nr:transglycosylase SLT domain-containing protein [Geomonas silvestris]GFO57968.1 murein transglycosylase [Geomonas silvestris]